MFVLDVWKVHELSQYRDKAKKKKNFRVQAFLYKENFFWVWLKLHLSVVMVMWVSLFLKRENMKLSLTLQI